MGKLGFTQPHRSNRCLCLQGPESKSMLFKLKSQFEELRSRVVFLERVKKYLEVFSLSLFLLPRDSSRWERFLVCFRRS